MVATFCGELFSLIGLWGVFLLWAGLLSGPLIYFGRHRARWELFEPVRVHFSVLELGCMLRHQRQRKELIKPRCRINHARSLRPVGGVVRVLVGHPAWRWRVSAAMIGVLTLLAVCLWAFIPGLPE